MNNGEGCFDGQTWVSIPFKRESPFGLRLRSIYYVFFRCSSFQFPSNGKVLSDNRSLPFRDKILVSKKAFKASEFQFPSNGKALSESFPERINFFQTEKLYCSSQPKFQFPSNGKVLSDKLYLKLKRIKVDWDSTEFQFPSNGKVLSDCRKAAGGL